MAQEALGLLECKGLVALMEGSDAMLKAANVEMVGWDKAGSGMGTGVGEGGGAGGAVVERGVVAAVVRGAVAAVRAAVDAGAEAAGRIGTVISVHVIARPHDELGGMMPRTKSRTGATPVAAGARK